MHVKRISKAVTIDCEWLEENLPDSLLELILNVISWFKAA